MDTKDLESGHFEANAPPTRRISLRDIAQATGVSVPTVSLALREDPKVAASTRAKVREMAIAMRYIPNPLLSSLATKQFRNTPSHIGLAYITSRPTDTNTYTYEEEAIDSARDAALNAGYHLESIVAKRLQLGGDQSAKLQRRGIAGLILAFATDCRSLPVLEWNAFSLIAIGPPPKDCILHCVDLDHFETLRMVWLNVREAGYRRIGIAPLEHAESIPDDALRHAAAHSCFRQTPERERIPVLDHCDMRDQERFIAWVKRHKPEAIIGTHTGQYEWLKAEGFRVPQDLAFACLHVRNNGSYRHIPNLMAGARFMRKEIIEAAVQILGQQVRHGRVGFDPTPRKTLLSAYWIDGQTLPRRR